MYDRKRTWFTCTNFRLSAIDFFHPERPFVSSTNIDELDFMYNLHIVASEDVTRRSAEMRAYFTFSESFLLDYAHV